MSRGLGCLSAISAVALAAVALAAGAPKAEAATDFYVYGRGYGHGVGMSQWGAYGFALRGYGYRRILTHYYPRTTLQTAPPRTVRVLLKEGATALSIGSKSPFSVVADGKRVKLAAGSWRLSGGKLTRGTTVHAVSLPLWVNPGQSAVRLGDRPYRGRLRVLLSGGKLAAVNHVGLESYLRGVVPGEVYTSWPLAALKAQAVAARGYALRARSHGHFDLYADVRSQVYYGVSKEHPRTDQAIRDTKAQALYHQGVVAATFFYASSGGRTAYVEDAWPSATPTPYLVSVADPYDFSPYRRWGPLPFKDGALAKLLGLPAPKDVAVTTSKSGWTLKAAFKDGEGTLHARSAAEVRKQLGLRSTWFRFAVASLNPSRQQVEPAAKATLTGFTRGCANVSLEERRDGSWAKVMPLAAGSFTVEVSPAKTTLYRLRSGCGLGTAVTVTVAPTVAT